MHQFASLVHPSGACLRVWNTSDSKGAYSLMGNKTLGFYISLWTSKIMYSSMYLKSFVSYNTEARKKNIYINICTHILQISSFASY